MINEGSIYLRNLANVLKTTRTYILLRTAQKANEYMKLRVFGLGKNADGGSMGKYISKQWATKRFNAGKQIAYVDLSFTGGLEQSIKVEADDKDAVVYIDDDKKYLIAQGQEEQRGRIMGVGKMNIWNLSKEEEKAVMEYAEDLIDKLTDRI